MIQQSTSCLYKYGTLSEHRRRPSKILDQQVRSHANLSPRRQKASTNHSRRVRISSSGTPAASNGDSLSSVPACLRPTKHSVRKSSVRLPLPSTIPLYIFLADKTHTHPTLPFQLLRQRPTRRNPAAPQTHSASRNASSQTSTAAACSAYSAPVVGAREGRSWLRDVGLVLRGALWRSARWWL